MNAKSVMKWRWANAGLFHQFPGEWIAFTVEKGIIGHHPKRKHLYDILTNEQGYRSGEFVMEYIHPDEIPAQPYRIRLVRIKSVRKKDWLPKYLIKLSTENQQD
jgi:Family of unknown function (DUF5678)